MLETSAQITTCLNMAGEDVTFAARTLPIVPPATDPEVLPSYIIKAIPGDTVYNIQNYNSPYDIERQDYVFRTSEQLSITNEIRVGDLFIYGRSNTSGRTYNFRIISIISDSTGWVAIKATLSGVS
jgi:hypothetical protein